MTRIIRLVVVLLLALVSPGTAQDLFWNDAAGIHRLSPADPAPATIDLFPTFETRGIAVDGANQRLVWSDILPLGGPLPGGVIRSASIRGGEITDIARQLTAPAGVALEPLSGKIFWTDLGDTTQSSAVFSANLDGSNLQKLISADWLSEIEGIAVDAQRKHLYFTYVNPLLDGLFNGGIARANLDGSNAEPILTGLFKPVGIALDSQGDAIYWVHQQRQDGKLTSTLEASSLDGQQRRTILGGLDEPFGIALDLDGRDIYWTDKAMGTIQRTGMSGILPFFEEVATGLNAPTAIAFVPEPGTASSLLTGLLVVACAARRRDKRQLRASHPKFT